MFNKNINNNNQKKSCLHKLCALLFLFLVTSCEDYGCIDADDFGEYQTYTFRVESSRLSEYCSYKDSSTATDQPSGIKVCFSKCTIPEEKKECGLKCEDECRANPGTFDTILETNQLETNQNAEPLWTSIGGPRNLSNIEHNSKILITAQGELNLGSEIQKSTVVINKNSVGKEDWRNLAISSGAQDLTKFSGKENINITIVGKFKDKDDENKDLPYFNSKPNKPTKIENNRINYYTQDVANGARRIFAYFIPFPDAGGYKKFPIAPDPYKTKCSIAKGYYTCSKKDRCSDIDKLGCDQYNEYMPSTITLEEDIANYNSYFSNFFDIDNLSKESSRHKGGTGFIRYQGDELTQAANVEADAKELDVSNLAKLLTFPNLQKDHAIKFKKIISPDNLCTDLKYTLDPPERSDAVYYPIDLDNTTKTYEINKEDLGKFHYKADRGCKVNVFFHPFHEIEFSESGYIEFGIPQESLPASGTTSCNLKFKIFNKNTQKDEFANFAYPTSTSLAKYYEAVETSPTTHAILSAVNINNPKKYFIRKGQILSFHPDSWNGTWNPQDMSTSSPDHPHCGVGFYVKLTPRPAVFCSDKVVKEFININQDIDSANDCNNLYYDKGKYTGCLEDRVTCNSTENFCPSECIPRDFSSCRASTTIPSSGLIFPPSTSCTPVDTAKSCYDINSIPPGCAGSPTPENCREYNTFLNDIPYSLRSPRPTGIKASCQRCIDGLKAQAIKPFYTTTDIGLQQCYDLENYTGTMEELKTKLIALTSETSLEAYKIFEDLKASGLKKLETFNGNYGNFYPLVYTDKDNIIEDLPIYKMERLISIGRAGYLKFIILDDIPTTAVNPDYFEIVSGRENISITSPLRINIKSSNELSNGEGLTIALCKENDNNNNTACTQNKSVDKQKNFPPKQKLPITEYDEGGSLKSESNYRFNDFGQLIRDKDIISTIPIISPEYKRECINSEDTRPFIGANFLCFRDQGNETKDPSLKNVYRLTFKIFDNETPTCKGDDPYEDCFPTGPTDTICNKFKRYNQNFDGAEIDSFCEKDADISCIKNYRCIDDKYANNEGHYDVAVKIRRDSKVKVSNFIDSIISPILGQVDGFYKTDQVVYEKLNLGVLPNVSEDAMITDVKQLKAIDSKIINKYDSRTETDNSLKPINLTITDPLCGGNCFISYVIKAVLIFEDPNCPAESITSEVGESCRGFTQCSFFASRSVIKYGNGLDLYSISSSASCKIKKVYIEYAYSKSDKPLYKENQVRRIYNSILVNPVYKSFLTLSIVLMFSFYGMGFLMGVSELKQSEIVDRLIKIAIIYLFTSPEFGWVWFEKFFVTFFKNGVDFLTFTMAGLFDEGGAIELALKTGNFSNKSSIFAGVDRVIHLFLINDVIHKKIGALLFYKFFGILYVMIIYYSAIAYVYTISNAVLIYLTSQFFTSVLFVVGPIFFVFILFKQTKGFFDNWLNALIGFGLQQIFLVFTLSLFNTMLYLVIKSTLGFRVCWDSVWQIKLPGLTNLSLLSFWTLQDAPPYLGEISNPSASGSSTSAPTIPRLLSLWTICVIMKSFIATITDLVALLSGGISATELGSSVANGMNKMIDQTQKKWGALYQKSGARIIDRADQKFFNSGALAKQARKKAKNAESSDNKIKDRMRKDGDKAVSNYKVENSKEYAGMTEAQKRGKLNEVKKEAMKDSAKSMGKTDKEADALMKDKSGSKYQGDNVFGAMMSIGKDRFKNGSFARKSLNEKASEFNTGMSEKEMDKAMKGMGDSDKREEFIDNVKNGNIEKSPGLKERLNPINIRKEMKEKAEERQIAINQLEKSGDIPRLASTFDPKNPNRSAKDKVSFALKNPLKSIPAAFSERSESAEEKILSRIKENREQQSVGGGREVDARNINRLEAFSKHLEAKEGKNDVNTLYETKKELINAENKPNEDKIKDIGNASNEKVIEKLNQEKILNNKEKDKAEGEFNSSKENFNSIANSISGDQNHREMDKLYNKINKNDNTSEDLKRFSQLKEKDQEKQSGDTFAEKIEKRSLAKKDLEGKQVKFENYEKKGEKIESNLQNLSRNGTASVGGEQNPQTPPSQPGS